MKKAVEQVPQLRERATWPRERIEAFQLERINAVWAHAVVHVPYYREIRSAHHLGDSFSSLAEFTDQVPLLEKDLLRQDPTRFRSDVGQRGQWSSTSGSTGNPMRLFHSNSAHAVALRARYAFYADWGVEVLDPTVFVWGGGAVNTGVRGRLDDARTHVEDRLRSRLRLSAGRMGHDDLRDAIARMERHRPRMLYGYTQAVARLAAAVAESGAALPDLRAVVVTGEVARPHVKAAIESAFGVPVVVEYGATECQLIAGTSPDGGLRVREDLCYVETIGRPDGRYDLALSVLIDEGFPLMRYLIGDQTDQPIQRCPMGFSLLGEIAGRDDDVLISASGSAVHSSVVDSIFESRPDECGRYQIHQSVDGSLDVSLETTSAAHATNGISSSIESEIRRIMGEVDVRVRLVESIAADPSGKHRVVSSELTRPPEGP